MESFLPFLVRISVEMVGWRDGGILQWLEGHGAQLGILETRAAGCVFFFCVTFVFLRFSPIFTRKYHQSCGFSMAVLVYQRVYRFLGRSQKFFSIWKNLGVKGFESLVFPLNMLPPLAKRAAKVPYSKSFFRVWQLLPIALKGKRNL